MFWNNMAKLGATIAFWIVLGTISGLALNNSNDAVPLTLVPLFIALIATFVIWVMPELVKSDREATKAENLLEKAKRSGPSTGHDKLDLLVSLMDEDELAAFKHALRQQILDNAGYADGELPYGSDTLESLLDEDRYQTRSRR